MKLLIGECLDLMATLAPESVDAIVTDPPYDLTAKKKGGSGAASLNTASPAGRSRIGTGNGGGFMGKSWDATGVAFDPATWAAALRVAKPGAHLIAFGGTRTFHRLTCAIEDAGWEIRDCLMWLYGQGFPKSHNLEGDRDGWGTALKPGWEPIILARKALSGTVAENVQAHGTGALNVDGTRVKGPKGDGVWGTSNQTTKPTFNQSPAHAEYRSQEHADGRWPANVVLDEGAAAQLDAQAGALTSGAGAFKRNSGAGYKGNAFGEESRPPGAEMRSYGDTGGASRFFYCAKASRAEREEGLDGIAPRAHGQSNAAKAAIARGDSDYQPGKGGVNKIKQVRNHHPTVKPVALMRWLVKLVTPPSGLVLDPFAGSGSTGVACALEGFPFLLIEREADYAAIINARVAHATEQPLLWRT